MAKHDEDGNEDSPWKRKQCFKASMRLSSVLRLFLSPLASAMLIEKLFTSALTCIPQTFHLSQFFILTRILSYYSGCQQSC